MIASCRLRAALGAALLCIATPAIARASSAVVRARSHGGPNDPDDPGTRARMSRQLFGEPTVAQQLELLRAARHEADRYRIGRAKSSSAVSGSAWINVGPTTASFERNGVDSLGGSQIDSGRLNSIVPHPNDPNILYVVTAGGGVWKTFNAVPPLQDGGYAGPHWIPLTDGLASLSVGALALDPRSPDTLLLGLGDSFDVRSPGFYTSDTGGQVWNGPVALQGTYSNGSQVTATAVRDIKINPVGTGVALAATNAGLFRSQLDGSLDSWKLVDPGNGAIQNCWSVGYLGPRSWLVACVGTLWRSTDDGASWANVTSALPFPDQGDVGRMTIAVATSDTAGNDASRTRVYLLAANASGGDQKDIYRSVDGGQSFTGTAANNAPRNSNSDQQDMDLLHDQAWYNQAITVDPRDGDRVFVGGNLSLARTQDGGRTWDLIANWLPDSPFNPNANGLPYVHADWHAMAISSAGTPAVFYAGTDGGLFASRDEPASSCVPNHWIYCSAFTALAGYTGTTVPDGSINVPGSAGDYFKSPTFTAQLNHGLVTHLVYSVASDDTDSANTFIVGGLQDNGSRVRDISADPTLKTSFDQVLGADGFGVAAGISPSNSTQCALAGRIGSLVLATIYAEIWKSIDCGQSFGVGMAGIPCVTSSKITNSCSVDYQNNFYMKLATDQTDLKRHTFLTIVTDAAPATTASVYRTTDGATGWTNISGKIHAPSGDATSFPTPLGTIVAHPRSAGIYATIGNNPTAGGDSRVYVTADGGANWSQGSQLFLISFVAFDPGDASGHTLWASTLDPGAPAYRSTDAGATWTAMKGSGAGALPRAPANTIKVDPNDPATIYLGTQFGLYRSSDAGASWARFGSGLPLVSVTEINVSDDSSALRISTYGRGFWEINPLLAAPAGVLGDGDFDHNQVIDAFDLVAEAAVLGTSTANADYDATGNLVGSTNSIDGSDVAALVAKLGGRP